VLIREQEYSHFIKKQGTLITAVVRRFSRDGYILSYDNYEFLLPSNPNISSDKSSAKDKLDLKSHFRSETILGERFGTDDNVNVYIKSVVNEPNTKYQVIASRTHPSFLEELLKQNVPEIRDERILINKIVRIPGLRAKVVVHSTDKNLDPVGACIGIRGARIKAISQELCGEKIDVIEYSDSLEIMVQNAIKPVKPIRVNADNDNKKIIVVVSNKDLSNAIGKRGVNTKLLSSMMNYKIVMLSEEVDDAEKKTEFVRLVSEFEKALDVEEIIAQLLVVAGYKSVQAIATSENNDLMKIEHFNEELVEELKSRANSYLESIETSKIMTVEKSYADFVNSFTEDKSLLLILIDNNIKTFQDLADLDIYELSDILQSSNSYYSEEVLSDILVKARKTIINSGD
jgi:N utilization substance protein A